MEVLGVKGLGKASPCCSGRGPSISGKKLEGEQDLEAENEDVTLEDAVLEEDEVTEEEAVAVEVGVCVEEVVEVEEAGAVEVLVEVEVVVEEIEGVGVLVEVAVEVVEEVEVEVVEANRKGNGTSLACQGNAWRHQRRHLKLRRFVG